MKGDLLFVVFTTVLALVTYWPQVRKVRITRATAGVSLMALLIGFVDYMAWVWYFFATGEVTVGVGTAVESLIWLWLILLVVWLRGGVRSIEVAGALSVAATLTVLGLWDPVLMGVALGFTVLMVDVPAIWAAWRSPPIGAISLTTWILTLITGVVWGWWGILNHSPGAWIYGGLVSVGALGVITAIGARRQARAHLTVESATAELVPA